MTRIPRATKVLMVAATAVATLAGTAGIASAGSLSGNCALSMVNDHRVPGGMEHAMSVDNDNGNSGMYLAVANSC